jgi:hypothetical protein
MEFFEKMMKTASLAFKAILFLLSNSVVFVLGVPILLVGIGLVSGALIIEIFQNVVDGEIMKQPSRDVRKYLGACT